MNTFIYSSVHTVAAAVEAGGAEGSAFLGGGTNLVDLMREGIARPRALIDVTALQAGVQEADDGGLLIGGATTNADVASNALVLERYPLLAEAIVNGASAQIRNMATVAGNTLQRTRCLYFYDEMARCNKRVPLSGCDALDGHNGMHAILGTSEHCVATHPSDMCVALVALDAAVNVQGRDTARSIPIADLHRLPGSDPHIDTILERGELVVSVTLPGAASLGRCAYRKVRERSSYAFALVAVAARLVVLEGLIAEVSVALGGVASKPWRRKDSEQKLLGKPPSEKNFEHLAGDLLAGARPLRHNGFKVELARRVVVHTLMELANRWERS